MTEPSKPSFRLSSSSTYQPADSDSGFLQRGELFETLPLFQTGKGKDVSVKLIRKTYGEDLINLEEICEIWPD